MVEDTGEREIERSLLFPIHSDPFCSCVHPFDKTQVAEEAQPGRAILGDEIGLAVEVDQRGVPERTGLAGGGSVLGHGIGDWVDYYDPFRAIANWPHCPKYWNATVGPKFWPKPKSLQLPLIWQAS